jgi:hypothetical protein
MADYWLPRTLVDIGGLTLIDAHTSANPRQHSTFLAGSPNSKLIIQNSRNPPASTRSPNSAVPASPSTKASTPSPSASPPSAPAWKTASRHPPRRLPPPPRRSRTLLLQHRPRPPPRRDSRGRLQRRPRRRGYLIAKLDARKLGRKSKPPSTPPQPESTEKPKEKKWLSLKNEALWSQVWSVDR